MDTFTMIHTASYIIAFIVTIIIFIGIPIGVILLIYVLIKKLIKYHAEVSGKQDEENRKFREGTTVGYKKDEP